MQKRRKPRHWKRWSHPNCWSTKQSLMRWKPADFQNPDPGTTPLTSRTTSFPRIAPYIRCHYRNKGNFKTSLTTTSEKDISNPQNLPWHHHFSLPTRKMENYDPAKIIGHSTKEPSRTLTLFLLFQNSSIN